MIDGQLFMRNRLTILLLCILMITGNVVQAKFPEQTQLFHLIVADTTILVSDLPLKIDSRVRLKLKFENDILTYLNTDRYYTNGLEVNLQAPWLSRWFLHQTMITLKNEAFASYQISLVQDMYTPTSTSIIPQAEINRPYSSTLIFGYGKTSSDQDKHIKVSSQLDIGIIGPYSGGAFFQKLIHKLFPNNVPPLGWDTQIKTDLVLNYNAQLNKSLINSKYFTLLADVDAQAGTLHDNVGAGFQLQAGKSEPVFGLKANERWPDLEYYFFARNRISYVAYNALLQGGVFNRHNNYTLPASEIERILGNAESGIHVSYKRIGFELAQQWLSPEYKSGLWHKWGRISLIIELD